MNKESAENYLKAGGMNEKQIKAVAGAFINDELQKIRQEIEKPFQQERFFCTETAKAQAIALIHCIDIIDKHMKGGTQ